MLENSKKVLFYSLMIISSISLINMMVLSWCPTQIFLSSHLVISLTATSFFLKAYYLIPLGLFVCILMLFAALSFLKERMVLPIISFGYFLCDLFFLAYSFFDAWVNDNVFIVKQAIQIFISITVITYMCIYIVLLRNKRKTAAQTQDDGSPVSNGGANNGTP